MAYGNYGRNNYGNNQGGGYQQRQGGYQQQQPQPIPFNMDEEINARLELFLRIAEQAEQKGIKLEEIKDFLGGWVTSLLIAEKDARRGK